MRMRTGLLVVVTIGMLVSKTMAEDTPPALVNSFPASQPALIVPESGANVPPKTSPQTAPTIEENSQPKKIRAMKPVPEPMSPSSTDSSNAPGTKTERAVTDSKPACCQPAHVTGCRHHCCCPIQGKTYRECYQSCFHNSCDYQQDYEHLIYGYQLFYGYRKW